jgi:hypothetical protein
VVYAIDNGLCFHVEPKLRTVVWDFGGEPIPTAILDDLRQLLAAGVPAALARLLTDEECAALGARTRALVAQRRFPEDDGGHRYPWPLV